MVNTFRLLTKSDPMKRKGVNGSSEPGALGAHDQTKYIPRVGTTLSWITNTDVSLLKFVDNAPNKNSRVNFRSAIVETGPCIDYPSSKVVEKSSTWHHKPEEESRIYEAT